ncbi:hypothetical protein [Jatrophihabitans sp.]|uniref:hypothetical protein n=1 Tax=Jatrophihabitans sp. TaxID=1932789 RepID=UPI002D116E3C|nr:hypothetical protein [Jatrophihabitans sp.]
MIRFLLVLLLIWVAIAVIGAVIKGLIWLTILAAILFLITLIMGSARFGRGRARR